MNVHFLSFTISQTLGKKKERKQNTQGLYCFMFLICKRHCHGGNNKTACSLADTACGWKQRGRNKALITPMNSSSSLEKERRLRFRLSNNVL